MNRQSAAIRRFAGWSLVLQPAQTPAPAANGSHEILASAVIQIADRIDLLNSDPGNRAPEIRAEVNRLKNLAQSFEN